MSADSRANGDVLVRCEPSAREGSVPVESTLLDAIHEIGLPVSQACEGAALCGFCRILVVKGGENLTAPTDDEMSVLAALHADDNERLACCARVTGPVTITTDYW